MNSIRSTTDLSPSHDRQRFKTSLASPVLLALNLQTCWPPPPGTRPAGRTYAEFSNSRIFSSVPSKAHRNPVLGFSFRAICRVSPGSIVTDLPLSARVSVTSVKVLSSSNVASRSASWQPAKGIIARGKTAHRMHANCMHFASKLRAVLMSTTTSQTHCITLSSHGWSKNQKRDSNRSSTHRALCNNPAFPK
jgi:hypothetical protein